MQNKRGISLIVLVITIIVMIILAAAIIISLNNTGIISNANTAKTKTDDKQIREAIEVAKLNLNFEGGINESNLQNELQKSLGVDVEVINNMDKSYTIKVKDMYYTLEEDETVVSGIYDKWDKTSTVPKENTNEIHIYKASELKWIQEEVEKGNTFENYKIYLENNLDFGARENAGDTLDEKWKTTSNKEYKWTPIGKEEGKGLKAEFDGKNHIIKGIYIEETTENNGIFGICDGSIKNLKIKNGYVEGANCTAGIVGVAREGCVVSNCHNINTTVLLITGEYYTVAGIVGQTADDVIDCTNSGNIIAYGMRNDISLMSNIGGVVGTTTSSSHPKIQNCINNGKIESSGTIVGGIIGRLGRNSEIKNCTNYAMVTCNGKMGNNRSMCGGIAGSMINYAKVIECANYGKVSAIGEQVGGITGLIADSSADVVPTASIYRCFNAGDIKGTSQVGGITGTLTFEKASITYCYNKGTVTGNSLTGSIIGKYEKGDIKHLYYLNTLNVKAVGNADYEDKNVTSTTKNINSFEEFKTWISQFK